MTPDEFEALLDDTFDDKRISRGEKHALREVLGDVELRSDQLAALRNRAFDFAKARLDGQGAREILDWLEDVVKVVWPNMDDGPRHAAAYFSPGDACADRIAQLFDSARRTADVCVFTITDNRITDAILRAHGRGVQIRIITDNDKSYDRGSDIHRLDNQGLDIRMDATEHHMHHKFALFDGRLLLTGSYNWTRSAARNNEENFVITDEQRLVDPFKAEFERLWTEFG